MSQNRDPANAWFSLLPKRITTSERTHQMNYIASRVAVSRYELWIRRIGILHVSTKKQVERSAQPCCEHLVLGGLPELSSTMDDHASFKQYMAHFGEMV